MSDTLLIRLVRAFERRLQLPIEITEVRDEIVRLGIQDEIAFSGEDIDTDQLFGAMYRYTRKEGLYSPPTLCTLIVYARRLPLEWQRVVCCKESIHIFDEGPEETNSSKGVCSLLDKLAGRVSADDFGIADIMAMKDRLALYQCLPVLFPMAARAKAREAMEAGASFQDIVNWTCLPPDLVEIVMSDNWPDLLDSLLSC
jgi:hypothetical protein